MRSELAERLLAEVVGWDTVDFIQGVGDLQALSRVKYDEYSNYGPGAKFVENLAMWLDQFPADRRRTALDFVFDRLVFVSEVQMQHLISLVYPEVIEPVLRKRIALQADIPAHRIAEIKGRSEFVSLRRRSLVLGASDGARLDRLRRASQVLSHEQFLQSPAPAVDQLDRMVAKLRAAQEIEPGNPCAFEHVFFVDDFSGSGRTLVREEDGDFTGKLPRLRRELDKAAKQKLVADDVPVTVVLYCASDQALTQVETGLAALGLPTWNVRTVQRLPDRIRVDRTDPAMTQLCIDFFDGSTEDKFKGSTPIGYSDCALPLVLSHNTPNNSVCLLWMDTRKPNGDGLRALFPRYERHHPDRQ